jgi:anti-sigma factor RsiW
MSTCHLFEIAIDQRIAGVLDEAEAQSLEAHVLTCQGCRAYEESARGQQRLLGARVENIAEEVDWARIERGIRRNKKRGVIGLVVGVLLGAILIPVASIGLATPTMSGLALAAFPTLEIAVVILLRAIFLARETRKIARLEKNEDMLAYYIADLRQRARRVRRLRWVALVVLGGVVICAVTASDSQRQLTYAFLGFVLVSVWGYVLLVRHPRVLRELEDLDRGRPES